MLRKRKGYIVKLRESRMFKGLALCVALNLIVEIVQPSVALALTEGPSQPEVQSFEPIGTTQMVDLFSGDFNYNIPLFNLPGPNGGYPVNIAYHAGISADDEASWVGLGWNINAGALVRNMRGLPDEFLSHKLSERQANSGFDHILTKTDMKNNWTLGLSTSFSLEVVGAPLDLGLNASFYYNSYKGVGVSTGVNIGGIGENDNFSLGLSLDSENGVGVSANVSHSNSCEDTKTSHGLSLNFNGDLSVSYTLGVQQDYGKTSGMGGSRGDGFGTKTSNSYGSSYTFANTAFSPSIGSKKRSYNITGNLTIGVETAPVTTEFGMGVFFNTDDYNDLDKMGRNVPVVGYDRAGSGEDKFFSKDFSRMNDGMITPETVFLGASSYNFDTYTSTGQGLSGYFRPRRNDIGLSHDQFIRNESWGFDIGFEVAAGAGVKVGIDGGGNTGWSTQGPWNNEAGITNPLADDFLAPNPSGIQENVYYQAHGEPTIMLNSDLSYLGGLQLARVRFVDKNADPLGPDKRQVDENYANFNNGGHAAKHRFVRNTVIHTLTNKEVGNLGEFKIKHYTGTNFFSPPTQEVERQVKGGVNIEDHKAGFKVLNEEGSYYVYGLPAYNLKEVDNLFSVPEPGNPSTTYTTTYGMQGGEVDYKVAGSHKFIHKTSVSPYAHSYFLTSVLGADYIDRDNDGPSDDDYGYWVKFDYRQTPNYEWRAPYSNTQVQYHRGASYHSDDDKGSYKYGEKELWYLARIETKSHIAIFVTSGREDNLEASGETTSSGTGGTDHGSKLDRIEVYEKSSFEALGASAVPLQTIHFNYNYDLCPGTTNSNAGNGGKLTLKSIHFESNGSSRGSLNKYEFDYAGVNMPGINPAYQHNSFDAWGTYRDLASAEFDMNFAYTNQFNQGWNPALTSAYGSGLTAQEIQDRNASAWCLNRIKLPSGGTIDIEYESDDYGYVQHKTAAQMFKIVKMGDYTDPDEIYTGGNENFADDNATDDEARRRIYFKLEEPITGGTTDANAKLIHDRYVAPLIVDESGHRNLYFRSKMRLTVGVGGDGVEDYVSGYLPLEDGFVKYQSGNPVYTCGLLSGSSTVGYVTVKPAQKKNGDYFEDYHPMALAGWTYLQTDAQEVLNNPNSFSSDEANQDNFLGKVVDIINVIPMLASSFGAIRSYCKSKSMAKTIDLDLSCIRLASPDKKKFGGGHRVKEIKITDNWNSDTGGQESSRTYGQHYEYTIEENGMTISSGVAEYEPQAAGDENALKYPVYFYGKANTFTKNNLFTEAPLNEALFPGASVGYRRVVVQSLNTRTQVKNQEISANGQGRIGGVTVNEFYTAKEFPTFVSYTQLSEPNDTKDVFKLPIIIPFFGSIKREYYHGAQAYMIETNDMHGKPKSTRTYEYNNYVRNGAPITESYTEYQCKPISYQGESCFKLDNEVNVIANDGSHNIHPTKRLMGVEVDLFTDQRKSKNFSTSVELDFNVDVPTFPVPLPSVWPSFSNTKSAFKTFVTNKVVHRTGIVKRTKSRDVQTVNESEILAYDEKSGHPTLTAVTNEFGDKFYSYNIPAYYHYDRMGHAYRNINFTFNAYFDVITNANPEGGTDEMMEVAATNEMMEFLVRGDELLILSGGNNTYKKAYFLGWAYSGNAVYAKIQIIDAANAAAGNYSLKVIRSGRRNHHGTMAANYLTKSKVPDLINGSVALGVNATTPTLSDGVLSATAQLFKEDWTTTTDRYLTGTENPFLTGNSGIWRPYKSYTYVGPRSSSADMADNTVGTPNLRNDGVMSNVPMFSYEIGSMEDYVAQWEWVNEVTRFSEDAYELENVNRLGIYSSALYGYDNSLTIAVGGNASMNELGAFDFEKVVSAGTNDWDRFLRQTNLNFGDNTQGGGIVYMTEQYNVKSATIDGSNSMSLETNIPNAYYSAIDLSGSLQDNVGLALTSAKNGVLPANLIASNEGFYFNGLITAANPGVNGYITLTVRPYIENSNEPKNMLKENGEYHGKVTLLISRSYMAGEAGISYSNKAHTGKKSMHVINTKTFEQPYLKVIQNKKYVLSLWVSRDQNKVKTFETSDLVEIGTASAGGGFNAITPSAVHYSKVVEGWQKIDIEFSTGSVNPLLAIRFNAGTSGLLIDDIRFSPKTGGITTYVYDPVKFWLRASLNADNYATLYYYDEEGNLTMKKQETEEGIFTITESRGHVSEN